MNKMTRPQKLYHGTNVSDKEILREGLKPPRLTGGSDCYIYTALTFNEARKWGYTVFEIDVDEQDDLRYFPDEDPVWQVLITNPISPQRLRVVTRKPHTHKERKKDEKRTRKELEKKQ